MDDLNIMKATSLWPDFPYLRVERRLDLRLDQPRCFVYAPDRDEVLPRVYFTRDFPPDEFDRENNPGIIYQDLSELVGDGWRVIDV